MSCIIFLFFFCKMLPFMNDNQAINHGNLENLDVTGETRFCFLSSTQEYKHLLISVQF